ncbi:predicted protein, partial [Nematostella vectensis]
CGPLASPVNGSIQGSRTYFPNKVKVTCDEGFLLRGSDVRVCQPSGRWSGTRASCQAVDCGRLPIPLNGRTVGNLTVFPNNISFVCDTGFLLSGSPVRYCLASGLWSGVLTLCQAPMCDPPAMPPHAYITFPRGKVGRYLEGDMVYFSCYNGYFLVGIPVIKCNKSWSKVEFTCNLLDCGDPGTPRNSLKLNTNHTFNNYVFYHCLDGHAHRGYSYRRCTVTGSWSNRNPEC